MIRNPYFIRYRQAMERSLSAQKSIKKTAENDAARSEDSAHKKPDQNQPCADGVPPNNLQKDDVGKPAGNSDFKGFRQIAPGIFQFRQPSYGNKDYNTPSELLSLLPAPENTQPQKAGEMGFKRVDGLPGPYQHYRTPVFQFT